MIAEQLGDAKLFTGDNVRVIKAFEDDCIDLTITSPPYDNLRAYNGFSWDFETLAKELFRVTKLGGVVVWIVGDATIKGSESGTSFRQALFFRDVCGFNLHDTMIYSSKKPPLTHNRYEQEFEYMFVFSKGRPKTFNALQIENSVYGKKKSFATSSAASSREVNSTQGGKIGKTYIAGKRTRIKGNIWHYNVGNNCSTTDKIAFQHPAIFPEQLASDHILSWSNEGDMVLDPFMGSGTTGKMALYHNRKFIGIELSQEYVNIAKVRIKSLC